MIWGVLKDLNVELVVFVIIRLYNVLLLIMFMVLEIDFICEGKWNKVLLVSFNILVVKDGFILISVFKFFVLECGLFNMVLIWI